MAPPRRRAGKRKEAPASAGASARSGTDSPPRRERATGPGRRVDKKSDYEELLELVPKGLATAFVNARLHDRAISIAGLSEPSDWDGEMPVLPDDIAKEDHDSLSNLMAAFASCLSTANWYATKARIDRIFCDQVAEYLEAVAILESKESNESKRKADAATNESVVLAKALAATAQADMFRFQTQASDLKLKHATVSRVGGFVADEIEAEEQERAPSVSTRGKSAGSERFVSGPRRRRK